MANIYDMVDTWNASGTTFTSIKMNVTDTASDAASLLMDLQVGGTSKFSVSKAGVVSLGTATFFKQSATNYTESGTGWSVSLGAGNGVALTQGAVSLGPLSSVRFCGSNAISPTSLELFRDADDTLAQRRSTNPQTFNLYNTYTDASNYERGFMKWNSDALEIGAEAAGTGTASREIQFINNGSTRLTINSGGHTVVTLGRSLFLGDVVSWTQVSNQMRLGGGSLEMIEQTAPAAPAANGVRIYAEDDGAGKTRLMALFATGAAQQIAIEP